MKSLVTALLIGTLSVGAWAEKGLVNETRTDASGQKTIVIKDYRPKKKRALKRSAPAFKEYDLGPSAVDYAVNSQNVVITPPAPQPVQQYQPAPPPQGRVQTYSQTYAPGPNRTMTPGGGGGSFASTVLPTYPAWGWYGYGPYYGNYGSYGYGHRRPCPPRPYVGYPSTYPGFLPGLPSGPPANLGYPVFNTISPPIIPGAGYSRCR